MNKQDWHPADILAALKKKGMTLSELSRQPGYASSTLANTLVRPWTKGEQIIAGYLNLSPETIWPLRYERKPRKLRVKSE